MLQIIMKRVAITAIALCIGLSAFAQKGKMTAGVYGTIGFPLVSAGGGAKFQYGITDAIRLDASFTAQRGLIKKVDALFANAEIKTTILDYGVNAHYVFWNKKGLPMCFYPLAGVGVYHINSALAVSSTKGKPDKDREDAKMTKVFFNLGFGYEFYFSKDRFSWFMEHKLGVGAGYRYAMSTGFAFHFNR